MNNPIQFPSETEVIREEVARYRAMTPEEQVNELDESFRLYHFLRDTSGREDEIDRLAEFDEERSRNEILAFAARHA